MASLHGRRASAVFTHFNLITVRTEHSKAEVIEGKEKAYDTRKIEDLVFVPPATAFSDHGIVFGTFFHVR